MMSAPYTQTVVVEGVSALSLAMPRGERPGYVTRGTANMRSNYRRLVRCDDISVTESTASPDSRVTSPFMAIRRCGKPGRDESQRYKRSINDLWSNQCPRNNQPVPSPDGTPADRT